MYQNLLLALDGRVVEITEIGSESEFEIDRIRSNVHVLLYG
jgi:hypothetical protein